MYVVGEHPMIRSPGFHSLHTSRTQGSMIFFLMLWMIFSSLKNVNLVLYLWNPIVEMYGQVQHTNYASFPNT